MHNYSGDFFGMHFFWWLLGVSAIVLIYYFINMQKNTNNNESPKDRPLEILEERYANGEISKDEYIESKETLGYY